MDLKRSLKKSQSIEVKGHLYSDSGHASSKDNSLRSSKVSSPAAEEDAVEKVVSINRHLLAQIDTLRLKKEIDERQHTRAISNLTVSCESKLKTRELEIENLKTDISKKDQTIHNFAQKNKVKEAEISKLQNYIDDLKSDVEASKTYADDIQKHLDSLQIERTKLESGDAHSEKDAEINNLQTEIENLKKNLAELEEELTEAKDTISVQRGQLRIADLDRTNTQIKFKEELAKLSMNMRKEVEKIRDVMKLQWNEMKELREQNRGMRTDLREIKDLLVSDIQHSHRSSNAIPAFHHRTAAPPLSLPGLSGEHSRMLPNRKKKH